MKRKMVRFAGAVFCCLAVVLTAGFGIGVSSAGEKTYGSAVCHFVKAYDGDTITVNIPGWPDVIGKEISVRIYGIDTPEIRQTSGTVKEKARNAKRLTESLCRKADRLELREIRRDKYFRLLADVYADGKSVAAILLKNGLARKYDGGTKDAW